MTAYPSWTSLTAGVTVIDANHWNEVEAAVDHMQETLVTNGCSLSAYSWTMFPVSVGSVILRDNLLELRQGIDYVNTNNVCSANNGTADGTAHTHDSTIDTHNTGVL